MSKILALALIGGGGFFAYKQGWLGELSDQLTASDGAGATVTPASLSTPGAGSTQARSKYEAALIEHDLYVSPWAARNREWVAAIMRTESASMNPNAHGSAGEWGVMQVKPGTAQDLARWGYNRMAATEAVLRTVEGGIYFGTAYLDYIARTYPTRDRDWIIKAYNGGPGWEGLGENYKNERERYLNKVRGNFNKNRGVTA